MRYFTVICFMSLFPAWLCAETFTLDQCLERGLILNPEIKAYQFGVREAEEGIGEAWGDFLPTLSLSYDNSRISNSSGGGIDTDYLDQETDRYSIRLSQPLFSGMSGVAGLEKARQSKQFREYELLYMKMQLVREIRTSFYDILRARQAAFKWGESVKRLENQQLIAKAWVDQQLAPRTRLLEVVVELSNAKHEKIVAQSMLTSAKARLEELIALEAVKGVEIEGNLQEALTDPCEVIDACLELSLNQRPDLQMMELNIAMANQDAKITLAKNLPRANLDVSWTDYQREYDNSLLPSDDRDYYTVTFNVSAQPFQGGRNIFAWRRQRVAIERLQSLQTNLRHTIITEVRSRFEEMKESYGLVDSANDGLAHAKEAYQLVKRSAELGITALDELLDAELRLTRAEIAQIDAFFALQQSRVKLDYAVGNSGAF